jgi:hypothetical protein
MIGGVDLAVQMGSSCCLALWEGCAKDPSTSRMVSSTAQAELSELEWEDDNMQCGFPLEAT